MIFSVFSLILLFVVSCNVVIAETIQTSSISYDDALTIAIQAYHYLFPIIIMDITRRQLSIGHGPMNSFHSLLRYPDPRFAAVVRPNLDTLYTSGWLDLTQEPLVVSAPDTTGRFNLIQMMDMWSDTFASPGKRTTGTGAGNFVIVPPAWWSKPLRLPNKNMKTIRAPTPYIWALIRTQCSGNESDYELVNAIQAQYKVTPLSQWGNPSYVATGSYVDSTVNVAVTALNLVLAMNASTFFSYGMDLLNFHSPHLTDWSMVELMSQVGMVQGEKFDFASAPLSVRLALSASPNFALSLIKSNADNFGIPVNKWNVYTGSVGTYGNYYLERTFIAIILLAGNPPADALYAGLSLDSDGNSLNAALNYKVSFSKANLPPANAFWSITMYDANQGYLVNNTLNRYSVGSKTSEFSYNSDGSLNIYIGSTSPGASLESNWLPSSGSASDSFTLTLRIYWPKITALYNTWSPQYVVKI